MKNNNIDETFKPLSFYKELFLKNDELAEYYLKKRKYQYDNDCYLKGIKWRDKLHPILLKLMSFDRKYINKQTINILNDKREKNDKPVIYAITHIGMYDYQIVCEAIKDHQYPFAGDPETMYRTTDGLLLELNGLIYCDTNSKEDRFIAKETAKEVLKRGENLLIYPEGIWNLSPNLLTLPLFPGIIDMALETNCDIIPVAVEQYDKEFVVNIGKNFKLNKSINNDQNYLEQKKEELRNVMATLKWEIVESRPIEKRRNIGTYEIEENNFFNKRLNEWVNPKTGNPYYNMDIINNRTFKIKNLFCSKDVFSYLKNIKLNKNTAFIFRKDISLPDDIKKDLDQIINNNHENKEYIKMGR